MGKKLRGKHQKRRRDIECAQKRGEPMPKLHKVGVRRSKAALKKAAHRAA